MGPIPKGLHVLHTCDNPPCVNPGHLFVGDHGDNMADMVAKGRSRNHTGREHPNAKLGEAQVVSIKRKELHALGEDHPTERALRDKCRWEQMTRTAVILEWGDPREWDSSRYASL